MEEQVDVFKNKGMHNLSRVEKIEYLTLKKQILSTQDKIIAKMLKDQNIKIEEIKAILQ